MSSPARPQVRENGGGAAAEGGPAFGHLVPNRILVGTWAALVLLTLLNVGAAQVDLGGANTWLPLVVAGVQASLAALFFMHLRWSRPFNAVVFLVALGAIALLLALTLTDTRESEVNRIPNYAPLLENP